MCTPSAYDRPALTGIRVTLEVGQTTIEFGGLCLGERQVAGLGGTANAPRMTCAGRGLRYWFARTVNGVHDTVSNGKARTVPLSAAACDELRVWLAAPKEQVGSPAADSRRPAR